MSDPLAQTAEAELQQGGTVSDMSNIKDAEALTNSGGNVVPNQSSTSMSPAPVSPAPTQSGGNCMFKRGGNCKIHRGGNCMMQRGGRKSHKKHARKSHKKHSRKSHKKHGRKSHKKSHK